MKKWIFPLIAGLLVLVSCKTVEVVKYEYRSTTMLGSRTVTITQDSIVTAYSGRAEATREARATTPEEWTALKEGMSNVDLKAIASLESPTNKRSTDASPYGMVKISTADSTYQSASFDGYDSHEMLAPLMVEIKKIAQKRR